MTWSCAGYAFAASACWQALLRWDTHYVFQAYGQIVLDLFLITWAVNRTGGVDSYVSNLYFRNRMSSILLEGAAPSPP
jgi:hypothetical protein